MTNHNRNTAEIIARCLDIASSCAKGGKSRLDKALMKEKFSEIAREVAIWNLNGEEKARLILRPMQDQLIQNHGVRLGRRLYWDFLEAFWLQSWVGHPSGPAKSGPADDLIPNRLPGSTLPEETPLMTNRPGNSRSR